MEVMGRKKISLRRELEKIRKGDADGLLRPEAVVEHARDPDSPLHPEFEWDDGTAAEAYRVIQARTLIRCVIVMDDVGKDAPAYVSLVDDRKSGGGYRKTEDVLDSNELLESLERTAKIELQGWLRRHEVLTGLCQRVAEAAGISHSTPKRKRSRK